MLASGVDVPFNLVKMTTAILKMHERLMEQGRAKKGKTAGSRGRRVGEREGRGNGGRQQSQMACLSGIETEDFSLICC